MLSLDLIDKISNTFDKNRSECKTLCDNVYKTSNELHVTNEDVINNLSSEDYVNLLIEEEVIPNIYAHDAVEKLFNSEFLSSIGRKWLEE